MYRTSTAVHKNKGERQSLWLIIIDAFLIWMDSNITGPLAYEDQISCIIELYFMYPYCWIVDKSWTQVGLVGIFCPPLFEMSLHKIL